MNCEKESWKLFTVFFKNILNLYGLKRINNNFKGEIEWNIII